MNVVDGRRPVTIVVPIYDDPEGVVACVESLIANVDLTRDKIILSNDVGPQADHIEALLLQLIGNHPSFSYNRNAENLGFVLNCNRAVLELDRSGNDVLLLNSDTVTTPGFVEELSAVLYSSPRHGVVTARSNNATIASLPDARRVANTRRPVVRSREVHAAVLPYLPRFTIAPVAMGFCFLVRRELIDAHGFFDETFSLADGPRGLPVRTREPRLGVPHRVDELQRRPRPLPALRPRKDPRGEVPVLRRRPAAVPRLGTGPGRLLR
jgi:GT2 family glycosyltransferase